MSAADLRKLAEEATPGPWGPVERRRVDRDTVVHSLPISRWRNFTNNVSFDEDEATAEYVAAANPAAILELLAERDSLRAELDRLQPLCAAEVLPDVMAFYDYMNEGSTRNGPRERADYEYHISMAVTTLVACGFRITQSPPFADDDAAAGVSVPPATEPATGPLGKLGTSGYYKVVPATEPAPFRGATSPCCDCGGTEGVAWAENGQFPQCTNCAHVCSHNRNTDDPRSQPFHWAPATERGDR